MEMVVLELVGLLVRQDLAVMVEALVLVALEGQHLREQRAWLVVLVMVALVVVLALLVISV